jgi:hypothetical protein
MVRFDRLPHALYIRCREHAGREASPTAAIIDSRSVKSAGKGRGVAPPGGACPRARQSRDPGEAGKKIRGKKRHLLVDTQGRLHALVHAADIEDRDGGVLRMPLGAAADGGADAFPAYGLPAPYR